MLQSGIVAEQGDSYWVLSALHNVLTQKRKGATIEISGRVAATFALPKQEAHSERATATILENSAESIVDKLLAEPDIAILRADLTGSTSSQFPHTNRLTRLNDLPESRSSRENSTKFKSMAMGELVLRESLPTLIPKELDDALELREAL